MNLFGVFFLVFIGNTSSQEVAVKTNEVESTTDTLVQWADLEYDLLFKILLVDGSDLKELHSEEMLFIDDSGRYRYKDSTFFSGRLTIYLDEKMVCDSILDAGTGLVEGTIEKGIKQGVWIEKWHSFEKKRFVPTKKMNYKNGQLHGDYFVFGANREVIPYQEMHGNPVAPTSSFENGTGMYVDFYHFPPYQLKVRGMLVKGCREGRWNVYDKDGEVIVSYIFRNGNCINL